MTVSQSFIDGHDLESLEEDHQTAYEMSHNLTLSHVFSRLVWDYRDLFFSKEGVILEAKDVNYPSNYI